LNKANHNGREIVSKQEFDMQTLGGADLKFEGLMCTSFRKGSFYNHKFLKYIKIQRTDQRTLGFFRVFEITRIMVL